MPKRKTVTIYRRELPSHVTHLAQSPEVIYSQSKYDVKGNLTEQRLFGPRGQLLEYLSKTYDESGFLTREKYMAEESENSEEKSYERDANGLIQHEYKHYADGSFDTTTYLYDSQCRIVEKVTRDDEGITETIETFTYLGDQLTEHKIMDAEQSLILLESYALDQSGNSRETERWDAESQQTFITRTTYNEAGRKKTELVFDEDKELLQQKSYEEDDHGRLTTIVDKADGTFTATQYTYDDSGNIVRQSVVNEQDEQLLIIERSFNELQEPVYSKVYIYEPENNRTQHYEVRLEYEYHS